MPWYNPLSWIYGTDALQKKSEELDADLAAYNAEDIHPIYEARGGPVIGYGTYQESLDSVDPSGDSSQVVADHLNQQQADTARIQEDVNYGFYEGLKEGYQNELNFVNDGLNTVGKSIWKAIPVWVWLAGAVALFIYLGGGGILRKAIRDRS